MSSKTREVSFRFVFSSSDPQTPSTMIGSPFISPIASLLICPPAIKGFSTQNTRSYKIWEEISRQEICRDFFWTALMNTDQARFVPATLSDLRFFLQENQSPFLRIAICEPLSKCSCAVRTQCIEWNIQHCKRIGQRGGIFQGIEEVHHRILAHSAMG